MSKSELACVYSALILADDEVEITADKMSKIIAAAGISDVESFWPRMFARALEGKDIKDMLTNVGAAGPAAAGGAAAGGAGGDAGAPAEEAAKEEEEEEEDDDMGFGRYSLLYEAGIASVRMALKLYDEKLYWSVCRHEYMGTLTWVDAIGHCNAFAY
eukprot:Clim_evm58s215 gene=Clim_evmTU58s215